MAFLTVNGLDIAIAPDELERELLETGGRARSGITGTLRLSRRVTRNPLNVVTTPQDAATAEALRGWLLGRGDYWGWNDSVAADYQYSAKGLAPAAGAVSQRIAGAGRFTGEAACAVDAPSTNQFLWSEDLSNAVWTKSAHLLTTDATTAPDGTVTADLFKPDTTSTTAHRFTQTLPTLADNTTQALSFFAKAGGYNWVRIRTTNKAAVAADSYINVSTGALGTVNTGIHTIIVRPAANGFYRVLVTWNSGTGATTPSILFYANPVDNSTAAFTGDGTSGVYFWGMQFEKDVTSCTSYIKTTSATATRSAYGYLPYSVAPQRDAAGNPLWDAFTVAGWWWAGTDLVTRTLAGSWSSVDAATSNWHLGTNSAANDSVVFSWRDAAGVLQSLSSGTVAGLSLISGWSFVAITYHRGTATARIYTGPSATLRATSTSAAMRTAYASTPLTIGGTAVGDSMLNGLIGPVWMLPYEATQPQLAALAGLASQPPALPYLRVTGDAVRNLPTTMIGEVKGSPLEPNNTAPGTAAYERVRFSVSEV